MISGRTRVFALLGEPVAHSLSPVMHNAAFLALGIEATYVPLRCRADDVPALIRALAYAGGGGNVTVPHKEVAARAVEQLAEPAQRLGACNTFWGDGGATMGDLTDVGGFLEALDRLDPPDAGWLIAGTGGAARAVIGAARERGAPVAVRSRDASRRMAFEAWAASCGVTIVPPAECGVLVNATPLGLHPGDALPIAPDDVPGARVAIDLVYARGETAWVKALRQRGLRAADGRAMLVAQGAAAFERWFPATPAPREVMRAAVDAALR
ncbi:MAG TPA: shikimate dehydrogenase [Gemmatimonadales bacterium]|nr:shikimate dehydrogenase [Gemmatimonadales bacterium]